MMESGELSSYQLMVQKNIEENRRILKSLGLASGTPVAPKQKVSRPNCLRKSISRPRNQHSIVPNNLQPNRIRTRRSSSVLQSVNADDSIVFPDTNNDEENNPPQKKIKSELIFGEIEGVRVGDWWSTRIECSAAGVHRPTVAGIHGKQGEGCYSIALSGGYEDDLDFGNLFTYTGSGGRDLKGTKANPKNLRTAPQSKDQVLEGPNAALATNVESKKPVRVIRGYKLESSYAPEEGYRYDGLYSVEKYWTATGLSGFKVYKFALKRLPDQDPPPWESVAQSIEPLHSKEPPATENKVSLTQINEVHNANSASLNECVEDSSLKLSPKIPSRERVRKQSFPQQILKLTGENFEPVSSSTSGFNEESENENLVNESLKLTENVPNSMNCLENDIECTLVNNHSSGNVESVKENNLLQRSNGNIFPHLCSTSLNAVQNKNNSFDDQKSLSLVCPLNSSEKMATSGKLQGSAVSSSHREYNEIRTFEGEENESSDFEGFEMSNYSDNKTQTSILNYFSPVKTPLENISSKSTVNPKSLRSNRLAYSSFINLGAETAQNCVPLNKNNDAVKNESVTPSRDNNCSNSIKRASPKKEVKSSSHKRKYSSLVKNINFVDLPVTKNSPSLMENLIKQNNDKLKLHNQMRPTKRKNNDKLSPVKPCSVILKRIKTEDSNQPDFIGWDFDGDDFFGCEEVDVAKAQETCNTFKAFVKSVDNFQESSENQEIGPNGFLGWDMSKEVKGASGLVPIAFIIDKLSKNCVQCYIE